MELREYIRIIKRNRKLFLGIWMAVIIFAFSWFLARPVSFDVSLPVEISRTGEKKTGDYQYDQYYRFLADEKYAEAVSQRLSDPTVVSEIFSRAGITGSGQSLRSLSKAFSAEALASNYIQVKFNARNRDDGSKAAEAIKYVLEQKNSQMNEEAKSENWFSLIFGNPAMVESKTNYPVVALLSAIGGLLVAIFAVLVREYWRDEF